ncbi:MAG TPA: metal/formaldehyde-sensitive transcriptional repressor [Nevskiaceae bacterium]|nr:metal/formaldehyde-sensitive transcriptional repressor [Nevskiaceae bacterium]
MSHTIHDKKKLLARAHRIRGQVEALERALDQEKGCAEVLHQIAAIRGATQGLMAVVMEGHIREHLAAPDVTDQTIRTQAADELIAVLRTYLK